MELSTIKKIPYHNFIVYSQKIAHLRTNPNTTLKNIQQLKVALNKENILYAKVWLKEKLEEL